MADWWCGTRSWHIIQLYSRFHWVTLLFWMWSIFFFCRSLSTIYSIIITYRHMPYIYVSIFPMRTMKTLYSTNAYAFTRCGKNTYTLNHKYLRISIFEDESLIPLRRFTPQWIWSIAFSSFHSDSYCFCFMWF